MIGKTLHSYLEEQCRHIAGLLPVISRKPEQAAVHRLRVGIKKARASLALAGHLSEHVLKTKRYIRLLRMLQAAAGALRDLQLQQHLLRRYAGNDNRPCYRLLQLLLQSNARQAMALLQQTAGAFPRKMLQKLPALLEHHHHAIHMPAGDALHYLQAQYAALALPAGRDQATQWHTLRKQIKSLHFQLSLLQSALPGQGAPKKMLDHTGKAGRLLGAWHDLHGLQQFIQHSMRLMKKTQTPVPAGMDELLKQVRADAGAALRRCREHLRKPVMPAR